MITFEKYSNNRGKKYYAKLLIFRCKSPDFGGRKILIQRLCYIKTSCREKINKKTFGQLCSRQQNIECSGHFPLASSRGLRLLFHTATDWSFQSYLPSKLITAYRSSTSLSAVLALTSLFAEFGISTYTDRPNSGTWELPWPLTENTWLKVWLSPLVKVT